MKTDRIEIDDTKEKILKAALKVFAAEGYVGAKTRVIAKESGFSEMTLFRKFRSKKNLFDMVLIKHKEKVLNEISALFKENKIEDPILSLSYSIRQIYKLIDNNFQFISIHVNESRRISECILDDFVVFMKRELEVKFPDINAKTDILAFNILYNIYDLIFNKKKNRSIIDSEEGLDELICNVTKTLSE